jgi:hypothetical protein
VAESRRSESYDLAESRSYVSAERTYNSPSGFSSSLDIVAINALSLSTTSLNLW